MSYQLVFHQPYLLVYSVPSFGVDVSGFLFIGLGVIGMGILDEILGLDRELQIGDPDNREDSETNESGDEDLLFEDVESDRDFEDGDESNSDDDVDELLQGSPTTPETVELQQRISALENEVEDIASSLTALQRENEHITESVQGIENNIRKLLEVYEIITRDANPFEDDIEIDSDVPKSSLSRAFSGTNESKDSDPNKESTRGKDSEADEVSQDSDSLESSDIGHAEFVEALSESEEDQASSANSPNSLDVSNGENVDGEYPNGGSDEISFEELKAEYTSTEESFPSEDTKDHRGSHPSESGSSDKQAKETTEEVPRTEREDPSRVEDSEPEDVHFFEDEEAEEASQQVNGEPSSDVINNDNDALEEGPGEKETESAGNVSGTGKFLFGQKPIKDPPTCRKPYLESIPDGFTSDLITIEWLEHIRRSATTEESIATVKYYENISWISPSVAEYLEEILISLDSPRVKTHEATSIEEISLTAADHLKSLHYIGELSKKADHDSPKRNNQCSEGIEYGL